MNDTDKVDQSSRPITDYKSVPALSAEWRPIDPASLLNAFLSHFTIEDCGETGDRMRGDADRLLIIRRKAIGAGPPDGVIHLYKANRHGTPYVKFPEVMIGKTFKQA